MAPVSSGYIINLAGERVAIFETGRTWCKINDFAVQQPHVRPDGILREGPEFKRPFGSCGTTNMQVFLDPLRPCSLR